VESCNIRRRSFFIAETNDAVKTCLDKMISSAATNGVSIDSFIWAKASANSWSNGWNEGVVNKGGEEEHLGVEPRCLEPRFGCWSGISGQQMN
jgi:hypothetical protein